MIRLLCIHHSPTGPLELQRLQLSRLTRNRRNGQKYRCRSSYTGGKFKNSNDTTITSNKPRRHSDMHERNENKLTQKRPDNRSISSVIIAVLLGAKSQKLKLQSIVGSKMINTQFSASRWLARYMVHRILVWLRVSVPLPNLPPPAVRVSTAWHALISFAGNFARSPVICGVERIANSQPFYQQKASFDWYWTGFERGGVRAFCW